MNQRFNLTHKTTYTYEFEATESYSQMRITPLKTICQSVHSHYIEVKPDVALFSHTDYYGNMVYDFSVPFRHDHLEIVAKSDVTTYMPSQEPIHKSQIKVGEAAKWFKEYDLEFYDYLGPSFYVYFSPTLREFAKKILAPERRLAEAVLDLNSIFTKEFAYRQGVTNINTPIDEILQFKTGVCQDFAHTMIAALRSVGIAARYVSGYIESYDPEYGVEMTGAEQSHAWLDVYFPDYYWVGLDPTNNMVSSEQHLRIATGRDFQDVSPVRGTFKGSGKQYLKVEVKMRRVKLETDILPAKLQSTS